MVSPVYFSMEQAPLLAQWVGWVSPMHHAADGIMKSFLGQTNIWGEFLFLVPVTVLAIRSASGRCAGGNLRSYTGSGAVHLAGPAGAAGLATTLNGKRRRSSPSSLQITT